MSDLQEETQYFFELTPERILTAVERSGIRCTGRILTLNSMENRVYEAEIETEDSEVKSPSDRFRVVKFYRPGRWTKEQILEEHRFLLDLRAQDIPVVAPLAFSGGDTLQKADEIGIYYAVFPKCGGRMPEEMNDEQLEITGRLLARVHNVGAAREAEHRISLTPETYGLKNLEYLLSAGTIVTEVVQQYEETVRNICDAARPLFKKVKLQRIHGDCHLANILWGREGPFLVDFDDMVCGPCVQDLWLILPGRDEEARRQMQVLLAAYESMRRFDRESLGMIESLRALRIIHFSAWIAKRWKDPAFQRAFPDFGSSRYWYEQLQCLREQLEFINSEVWS